MLQTILRFAKNLIRYDNSLRKEKDTHLKKHIFNEHNRKMFMLKIDVLVL